MITAAGFAPAAVSGRVLLSTGGATTVVLAGAQALWPLVAVLLARCSAAAGEVALP
jgi:hypothetical protein